MRRVLAVLALVLVSTGCTAAQLRAWVGWHAKDPDAAIEFAQRPEIIVDLATGEHESDDTDSSDGPQFAQYLADGDGTPGDCSTYADDMAAVGLPVSTFTRIGWRESGCNPYVWVVDRDDDGGAMFGLNFKGSMAGYWRSLCGATKANIRGNVPLIMRCAAAEYRAHGLTAWR